jgi:1-deoxy-D-xylulose-5-phosphate synthase
VPGKPDACLVAVGTPVRAALAAAEALAQEGVAATVVDARFVKPLDEELIRGEAARAGRVVTVEEGCLPGGFGSACLEAFERGGLLASGLSVRRLGLPDQFVTHGDPARQRAEIGIDAAGIARACRELLGARATRGAA